MTWFQSHIADAKKYPGRTLFLAAVIVWFIIIMIVVWKPSALGLENAPYGYDKSYWIGVQAGVSGMAIFLGWHLLFDMTHMTPTGTMIM